VGVDAGDVLLADFVAVGVEADVDVELAHL
jgi:hypothetical protein